MVKYWDNPIVIGKKECIEKLLEHILFPTVEVYGRMGDCWRYFYICATSNALNSNGRSTLLPNRGSTWRAILPRQGAALSM